MLRLPIAHAEGNYANSPEALSQLEANGQVVFRYCDQTGRAAPSPDHPDNPNGSENAIAGICSRGGNVCALMPHPERAAEEAFGDSDGLALFESVVQALTMVVRAG